MRRLLRSLGRRPGILAGLGFLLVVVLYLLPAWLDPTHDFAGYAGDAQLQIWLLGWPAHALETGHNLFLASVLNAPHGADLLWSPAVTPWGLVLAPLVDSMGVVFAYNVALTLALTLDGWAMYLLARRAVGLGPVAGFIAGLLFIFCPFISAHATGHLHMVSAFLLPIQLTLLHEVLVRQRRSAWGTGAMMGGALGLQLLLSSELLLTTVIALAVVTVVLALGNVSQIRARLPYVLTAVGTAALVAAVLCAYPLHVQLDASSAIPLTASIENPSLRSTALLNLIAPSQLTALAPSFLTNLTPASAADLQEWTGYVGIPLLVLAGWVIWRLRRDTMTVVIAVCSVVMFVLSLGPHLRFGDTVTAIPLPWLAVSRLPLFRDILTERLSVYVDMGLALLVGKYVQRWVVNVTGRRSSGTLVLVLVLASFMPILPMRATSAASPALFTTSAGRAQLQGRNVLILPYPASGFTAVTMLWQAEAGYSFSMPDGYILENGPGGSASIGGVGTPLGSDALRASLGLRPRQETAAERRAILRDLSARDVTRIVVGPSSSEAVSVAWVRWLVGTQPRHQSGVDIWDLGAGTPAAAHS